MTRSYSCAMILMITLFLVLHPGYANGGETVSAAAPSPLHVFGSASYYSDAKTWQPLTKGTTIAKEQWIGTDPKSTIILGFNGNDTITLSNSSMGSFSAPTRSSTEPGRELWNQFQLEQGSSWIRIESAENEKDPFTIVTPTAKVTAKKAIFEVVKGKMSSQPEEFWVWEGSITVRKKNKEVIINAHEKVILMGGQALPDKGFRFNPQNVTAWQKWNARKDGFLAGGDMKNLEGSTPPIVTSAPLPTYQGGAGAAGSSGSPASSAPRGGASTDTGGQGNSNFNYQEIRDRIRIPPAYKP
jgi:hypothetical protein